MMTFMSPLSIAVPSPVEEGHCICDTSVVAKPALDIEELTSEERLNLIGQLWDSLDDGEVPLTEPQRDALDQRLDDLDREGPVGVPWEQVRDSLVHIE